MKSRQSVPLFLLLNPAVHNELSTWVKIHALYPNSIIFNFHYDKLTKATGLSHTTLRKHIKLMLQYGWCYMRDGHLCFKGLNKLAVVYQKNGLAKDSPLIPVQVCERKSDQVDEFKEVIILNSLNKQKRRIKKKTELVKLLQTEHFKPSKKQRKSVSEVGGLDNYARSINPYCTLSNKKIGYLIERSPSTGKRVQKRLRAKKKLKVRYRFDIIQTGISPSAFQHFRNDNPEPFYIYDMKGGRILKQLSNEYESINCNVGVQKV